MSEAIIQAAPVHPQPATDGDIVLRARGVTVAFGKTTVLENLSLDVYRGEILGFIGPSGAGKSVLLRTVLGLNRKQAGTIELFGVDIDQVSDQQRVAIDMRLGVAAVRSGQDFLKV